MNILFQLQREILKWTKKRKREKQIFIIKRSREFNMSRASRFASLFFDVLNQEKVWVKLSEKWKLFPIRKKINIYSLFLRDQIFAHYIQTYLDYSSSLVARKWSLSNNEWELERTPTNDRNSLGIGSDILCKCCLYRISFL